MSGPPRLTVSTQPPTTPGPSSSTTNTAPTRRPQGARRRNVGTGLFIANPDESDGEGDSPRSAGGLGFSNRSPVTASSSSSGKIGIPIVGAGSGDGSGSPSSSKALPNSAASSYSQSSTGVGPTIPAPQSTPLPSATFSPSPLPTHASPSPGLPHTASPDPTSLPSPLPPQPPPQPERHMRRAFTTPGPGEPPPAPPAARPSVSTTGIANAAMAGPSSPSRNRPPLPSPPPASASSRPSPVSAQSMPLPLVASTMPPPPYPVPPTPSDRMFSPIAAANKRVDSPESLLSPAGVSDSGRSFASAGSSDSAGRPRSGSNAGLKKVLQVTMDNEQFTIVDITGMNTAEAIMERVFSKLRFRDDDYSTLSLYRTDIGEAADPNPISKDTLLHLCATEGDSRATLKFLVLQTGVPGASSASVVPPLHAGSALMSPTNDFAPRRTPSRHSKDDSLSSTSEVLERGGVLGSDWSDLGQEGEDWQSAGGSGTSGLHRSRRSVKIPPSARPIGSTGSQGTSSPSLPTPASTTHLPLVDVPTRGSPNAAAGPSEPKSPVSPIRTTQDTRKGTMTPTPNQNAYPTAGPSRRTAGLELQTDDAMDAGTAALIAQFTRENQEAMQAAAQRKRQLEADEEYARREQQSERDVWQMMQQMQLEQRRREQEQIENDERQARQVEAEERRRVEEEERRAREQRERQQQQQTSLSQANRGQSFSQDRRQLRQEWQNRGGQGEIGTVLPALGDGPYPPRRPSDGYPSGTIFDDQLYTSPAQSFTAEVPSYNATRRPTGFASGRYEEEQHARERLNDPRLQHVGSSTLPRRGQPRHPYLHGRDDAYRGSLGNARSMDNLRPLETQPPVSRPPYQGVPPRSSITPNPGGEYPYRERSQDGRYPDAHTAPPRPPPLHLSSSSASVPPTSGFMEFPSPRPSGSGTWTGFPSDPPRRPSWERGGSSPRPSSTPDHSAPGVRLEPPRRPSTYHDDSPPATVTGDYSHPGAQYSAYRPRSGSGSIVRARSPQQDHRRASESSAYDDREYPQDVSPPSTWLAVPRSGRRDTSDTISNAGTVSSGISESTVRPRRDDEESADTVKAGDLASQWSAMVARGRDENAAYRGFSTSALDDDDDDEDDEASLWITGPGDLGRHGAIRPVPSRPELKITTSHDFSPLDERTLTGTASDSATDSENEANKIQRHRSFATKRGQWHVRPEPGELYDNLDALFPKIDLDKPIIEPHQIPSTPSTPALDSPKTELQPPPIHPTRAGDPRLPQSPKLDKDDHFNDHRMPPPVHPARPNLAEEIHQKEKEKQQAKFNKQENRKSIRYIAQDWKRKALSRQKHDPKDEAAAKAAAEEKNKLERRKSSSMWGHKVVEVTPSKLLSGQVGTIPESPSSENKPATLTWVKGELIGKGSYGRVYIALNVTTGDMMAVKQVELPATERDRHDRRQLGMVEALQSEIALLKDLYHPNIVQYLGTETSPEYLSIFLEYVPGGTIASIYRTPNQAHFEEQLVKFFTAQILEGLAYLHNKHIWHRDLKGDNILVDAAGVCKISDFGISKQAADAYDSFGQATNMKGSVFWMAPEVIHSVNERTYSGKVDIWSLGCVVLEMWTGTRPWGAMEQVAAMFELFNKRARPPLPPGLHLSPVALDFLNEKCLAKDPRDRPTARELLKHDFITDSDPKWTFAESRIGKAVGKRAKSAKSVQTPGSTAAAQSSSGSQTVRAYELGV